MEEGVYQITGSNTFPTHFALYSGHEIDTTLYVFLRELESGFAIARLRGIPMGLTKIPKSIEKVEDHDILGDNPVFREVLKGTEKVGTLDQIKYELPLPYPN